MILLTSLLGLLVLAIASVLLKRCIYSKNVELGGFHVLITGGSSGIGLSLAKLYYKAGAQVSILARDPKKLSAALKEIDPDVSSGRVYSLSIDVTTAYDELKEKLDQYVARTGSIDILIHCAGFAVSRTFLDTPVDSIDCMLRTNYLSAVHVTKILLPNMLDNSKRPAIHKRIAFVCSMAGQIGLYGLAAYAGSKYALRGFAEALDMELGRKGPYVTLAFPPDTDTPGFALENIGKPTATKEMSAAGGLVSPDDVARSIFMDVLAGKFISSFGLVGSALSWLTAGMLPPVSTKYGSRSSILRVIFGSLLEILAATPLRAVAIGYSFWLRSIVARHDRI